MTELTRSWSSVSTASEAMQWTTSPRFSVASALQIISFNSADNSEIGECNLASPLHFLLSGDYLSTWMGLWHLTISKPQFLLFFNSPPFLAQKDPISWGATVSLPTPTQSLLFQVSLPLTTSNWKYLNQTTTYRIRSTFLNCHPKTEPIKAPSPVQKTSTVRPYLTHPFQLSLSPML